MSVMMVAVLILASGMVQRDWYAFEPDGKGFRAELPGRPNSTSSRTVTNAAGRSLVTTAQLRAADATYSVQLTEGPARVNPTTLDDGIRRFCEANHAELG